MNRPDHAREIKLALTDPRDVCERLGLLAGKGSFARQSNGLIVRCPAHEENTPSCSVQNIRGVLLWRCHGCDAAGDALDLIAKVHCLSIKSDFGRVLLEAAQLAGLHDIVHELTTGKFQSDRPRVERPTPEPEPDREWPDRREVLALWNASSLLTEDSGVSEWLRERAIDPDVVDSLELARAIPKDAIHPPWAVCKGGNWSSVGYRLVFPMYSATGELRSVRAGRVVELDRPKRLPPYGCKASELVLADTFGQAMLRCDRSPERVIITEGESDFLTWATRAHDPSTAHLGIVSGSWTRDFAQRIPMGARVVIRTDPDPRGEQYAQEIARTLRGRCFVKRAA